MSVRKLLDSQLCWEQSILMKALHRALPSAAGDAGGGTTLVAQARVAPGLPSSRSPRAPAAGCGRPRRFLARAWEVSYQVGSCSHMEARFLSSPIVCCLGATIWGWAVLKASPTSGEGPR